MHVIFFVVISQIFTPADRDSTMNDTSVNITFVLIGKYIIGLTKTIYVQIFFTPLHPIIFVDQLVESTLVTSTDFNLLFSKSCASID
jgi:hypothetical protein